MNKPSQAQLVLPMLEIVQQNGGRGKPREVAEALADRFHLSRAVRDETVVTADGERVNVWRRHVRWARRKAYEMGFLKTERRGVWVLTDEGDESLGHAEQVVTIKLITNAAGETVGAQIALDVAIPTIHTILQGDARDLSWIGSGEIPLIVTSVPYHDLIDYGNDDGQLALIESYDEFVDALTDWMRQCYRILTPGGRLACNVGDVLRSRAKHGRHYVLPLHSDIETNARKIGFENLTGIFWEKIGNIKYEQGAGGVLGKPGQPNQIIQQGGEHILLLRRPGYRSTTKAQREASAITKGEYSKWFRPTWSDVPGAKANNGHPAPFPLKIAYRLIRMFSFVGDTAFDPFAGQSTTARAAMQAGRNSLSTEIHLPYVQRGIELAHQHALRLAA